jgi:hypothetical protein
MITKTHTKETSYSLAPKLLKTKNNRVGISCDKQKIMLSFFRFPLLFWLDNESTDTKVIESRTKM